MGVLCVCVVCVCVCVSLSLCSVYEWGMRGCVCMCIYRKKCGKIIVLAVL